MSLVLVVNPDGQSCHIKPVCKQKNNQKINQNFARNDEVAKTCKMDKNPKSRKYIKRKNLLETSQSFNVRKQVVKGSETGSLQKSDYSDNTTFSLSSFGHSLKSNATTNNSQQQTAANLYHMHNNGYYSQNNSLPRTTNDILTVRVHADRVNPSSQHCRISLDPQDLPNFTELPLPPEVPKVRKNSENGSKRGSKTENSTKQDSNPDSKPDPKQDSKTALNSASNSLSSTKSPDSGFSDISRKASSKTNLQATLDPTQIEDCWKEITEIMTDNANTVEELIYKSKESESAPDLINDEVSALSDVISSIEKSVDNVGRTCEDDEARHIMRACEQLVVVTRSTNTSDSSSCEDSSDDKMKAITKADKFVQNLSFDRANQRVESFETTEDNSSMEVTDIRLPSPHLPPLLDGIDSSFNKITTDTDSGESLEDGNRDEGLLKNSEGLLRNIHASSTTTESTCSSEDSSQNSKTSNKLRPTRRISSNYKHTLNSKSNSSGNSQKKEKTEKIEKTENNKTNTTTTETKSTANNFIKIKNSDVTRCAEQQHNNARMTEQKNHSNQQLHTRHHLRHHLQHPSTFNSMEQIAHGQKQVVYTNLPSPATTLTTTTTAQKQQQFQQNQLYSNTSQVKSARYRRHTSADGNQPGQTNQVASLPSRLACASLTQLPPTLSSAASLVSRSTSLRQHKITTSTKSHTLISLSPAISRLDEQEQKNDSLVTRHRSNDVDLGTVKINGTPPVPARATLNLRKRNNNTNQTQQQQQIYLSSNQIASISENLTQHEETSKLANIKKHNNSISTSKFNSNLSLQNIPLRKASSPNLSGKNFAKIGQKSQNSQNFKNSPNSQNSKNSQNSQNSQNSPKLSKNPSSNPKMALTPENELELEELVQTISLRSPFTVSKENTTLSAQTSWLHTDLVELVQSDKFFSVFQVGKTPIVDQASNNDQSIQAACQNFRRYYCSQQKTPVTLSISYHGLRVSQGGRTLSHHQISSIVRVCQDPLDGMYFGFTVCEKDGLNCCYVYKAHSEKCAKEAIMTLGQVFELAFQLGSGDD